MHTRVLTPQAGAVKEIFEIVSQGTCKPTVLEEVATVAQLDTGTLQRGSMLCDLRSASTPWSTARCREVISPRISCAR